MSPQRLPGQPAQSRLPPLESDRSPSPRGASRSTCPEPPAAPQLVGDSDRIAELRRMIQLVAPTTSTVLVTGETGTGKEVVARQTHAFSERAARPFVAVNCAATPENLFDSELFGHERGAFTGAAGARPGYFEQANTGTLFLDEVADIPLHLQPKLLRVLQEQEVRRLGATGSVRIDVRVIAATNCDLVRAVQEGRFRPDLYYRLRVVELRLPPLRQRKEDIPPLCEHFLKQYVRATGSSFCRVSPAAMDAMDAYGWPGNVRELQNMIERTLVLARLDRTDALLPHHLPAEFRVSEAGLDPGNEDEGLDLPGALRRVRSRYLVEALRQSGGNRVEAARLLGISRRSLYDLLAENGSGSSEAD